MELTEEIQNSLHIARAIAGENSNTTFGPPHLLKALLHKDVGLIQQLEAWGEDIYFIEEWAEVRIESYPKGRLMAEPKGDELLSQVLDEAENICIKTGKEKLDPLSLLAAISTPGIGFTYEQLKTFPLNQEAVIGRIQNRQELDQLSGKPAGEETSSRKASGKLLKYCRDMHEVSPGEEAEIFVGREQELISMAEILCRKSKPNILLIGDAGVGKTALVNGLVREISQGNTPPNLKQARIFELDLNALLGGISYKGEAEDRFQGLLNDLSRFALPVLFIDDLHGLFDKTLALQGIINILKAELSKRNFMLIGTALSDEYRKKLEPETSLMRWCEVLTIQEPEPEQAADIVMGSIGPYARHHQVQLSEEVVQEAVKLSKRYIKERKLPDSAIDVLDRSMAALQFMYNMAPQLTTGFSEKFNRLKEEDAAPEAWKKLYTNLLGSLNYLTLAQIDEDGSLQKQSSAQRQETKEDWPARIESILEKISGLKGPEQLQVEIPQVAATISKICGIPAGKILSGERERLIKMEAHLQQKVIGQDQAVKALADAILESRSGLSRPGQPIGSFFLLGPTGTGKTELAKQLADFLFQSSSALIRFDMSEFKEEHSAALLYGAPPGYVGYEEGGLLVNKIRQQPYSVVLFDEIEKAHSSVFDIFLQILDEGKIHDKLGRQGDFSNAVILFTSNIGSSHIVERFNENNSLPSQNELSSIMARHFRPEFLGRLSGIVPFAPIRKEHVIGILKLQLNELEESLQHQGLRLSISDTAADKLATDGYSPEYGARPLRSVIRTSLKTPLSRMIISGQLSTADMVVADLNEEGEIEIMAQAEALTQV